MRKGYLFSIIVFSFFLFIPVTALTCENSKKLSNKAIISLQKAKEFQKKNEFQKGIDELNNFISKNSDKNHHFIEYLLGSMYMELNQPEKAITAFEQSVNLCDKFAASWQNIGKISFELKDYKKASIVLEKAYYLSKNRDKNILFASAMAYRSDKNIKKAFELLSLITSENSKNKNHINAYVSLGIQLKKYDLVLKRLNQLINNNESAYLLKLAANTSLLANDYKKALNYLTIYSMVKKDLSFKDNKLIADLLRSLDAPYKAVKYYEKALNKKDDLKVYKSGISSLIEACEYKKAIDLAEKAEKKYPNSSEILRLKGFTYYQLKDFKSAYIEITKAVKSESNDKNSYILLAYCAGKSGNIEDAKKLIKKSQNIKSSKKALKILQSFDNKGNL